MTDKNHITITVNPLRETIIKEKMKEFLVEYQEENNVNIEIKTDTEIPIDSIEVK
jgi:hypothetical protein